MKEPTFKITCLGAAESAEILFTDYDKAVQYFKDNFETISETFNASPFIFAENYDFREDPEGCKIIRPAVWRDGEKVYPL